MVALQSELQLPGRSLKTRTGHSAVLNDGVTRERSPRAPIAMSMSKMIGLPPYLVAYAKYGPKASYSELRNYDGLRRSYL